MVELAAIKVGFEGIIHVSVGCHVVTVRVAPFHRLLHHELRIAIYLEPSCAAGLCHPHPIEQSFVFGFIV